MTTSASLTIGQLAKEAGVGIETIRFYEKEGLLEEPLRRTSGYREYSQEAVKRLLFIRRAKLLGFSLKEIQELLVLLGTPSTTCREIKEQAKTKVVSIEAKIKDLEQLKAALVELTGACSGSGPLELCPILEALETSDVQITQSVSSHRQ
jgi:MerR family copper efflux transcriptional regulator